MVAHLVMLRFAESKQTRGKTCFSSSSEVLLTGLCRGLCSRLAAALLSHDSASMSVLFHSLAFGFESHEKTSKANVASLSLPQARTWPKWRPQMQMTPPMATALEWSTASSMASRTFLSTPKQVREQPHTFWFIHMHTLDGPTCKSQVCSDVETLGCLQPAFCILH